MPFLQMEAMLEKSTLAQSPDAVTVTPSLHLVFQTSLFFFFPFLVCIPLSLHVTDTNVALKSNACTDFRGLVLHPAGSEQTVN